MQISTTNDVGGFCEKKLNYHVPINVISFSYEKVCLKFFMELIVIMLIEWVCGRFLMTILLNTLKYW